MNNKKKYHKHKILFNILNNNLMIILIYNNHKIFNKMIDIFNFLKDYKII